MRRKKNIIICLFWKLLPFQVRPFDSLSVQENFDFPGYTREKLHIMMSLPCRFLIPPSTLVTLSILRTYKRKREKTLSSDETQS